MPKNTLIRVVTQKQGKQPRPQWFTFSSLTGPFLNRLFKVHHKLEVEEICIDEKGNQSTVYDVLTKSELQLLIDHWPQLRLPDSMPPEPEPLKAKDAIEDIEAKQVVDNDEQLADGSDEVDYSNWDADELKDLLSNNKIKFDKRIKNKEKLIELIKTNNL